MRPILIFAASLLALAPLALGADPISREFEPPEIVLLEPGDEPRRLLQYALEPGDVGLSSLVTDQTHEISVGGMERIENVFPRTIISQEFRVVREQPEDAFLLEWRLVDPRVEDRPGVAPGMTESIRPVIESLDGFAGTMRLRSDGAVLAVTMAGGADLEPTLLTMLDGIIDAMKNLNAPLPAEPVGEGAEWSATIPIEVDRLTMTIAATYTLESIEGDLVALSMTMAYDAEPGQIMHEAPGRFVMTLDSLAGAGTGRFEFDLREIMKVRGEIENVTTMKYTTSRPDGQSLQSVAVTTTRTARSPEAP